MNSNVEHPKHYQINIDLEAIDIIEIITRELKGVQAFKIGNVLKYLLRAEKKNGIEDYKKALFYLEDFKEQNFLKCYHKETKIILDKCFKSLKDEVLISVCWNIANENCKRAYVKLKQYIEDKEVKDDTKI